MCLVDGEISKITSKRIQGVVKSGQMYDNAMVGVVGE